MELARQWTWDPASWQGQRLSNLAPRRQAEDMVAVLQNNLPFALAVAGDRHHDAKVTIHPEIHQSSW